MDSKGDAPAYHSRTQFHRLFRTAVEKLAGAMRRRLLLERAAYQLAHTGMSVTDAALDANCGSLEAFTRAFRKAFRTSPSLYRRMRDPHLHLPASNKIQFLAPGSPTKGGRDGILFDRLACNDSWHTRRLSNTRGKCAKYYRSRKQKSIGTMRTELLRFNGAVERDPAIDAWMKEHAGELAAIAHQWFEVMRKCGDEVRELLHDGCPVACLGDAPFGYVNLFTSHVSVGFFHGAALPDPARLLQGAGKCMRHVKLRPGTATNTAALSRLIDMAYTDIKSRIENG